MQRGLKVGSQTELSIKHNHGLHIGCNTSRYIKECLKNNIVPFIILDKDKLFYYRGLKEYQNRTEKGYLIDTCLNAQDQYTALIEYYLKNY